MFFELLEDVCGFFCGETLFEGRAKSFGGCLENFRKHYLVVIINFPEQRAPSKSQTTVGGSRMAGKLQLLDQQPS